MTGDAAEFLILGPLARKVGSLAKAHSIMDMMDAHPEMSIDECIAEFDRAQREDVR